MVATIAAIGLLAVILVGGIRPQDARFQVQCQPCVEHLPPDARLVATATSPPDAAGATDTLAAYFIRDPSFSVELGRVGAIAVRTDTSGERAYPLGEDFGENPRVQLVARDLNADGVSELGIFAAVGAHSSALRIFRWNGSDYALVGDFFGDGGVSLRDVDGDGADEVIVGLRHYDRAQLRHDAVMRWDGATWAADYQRWGFAFDSAVAREYPEAAVLQYYLLIAAGDYRAAYGMLGPSMRSDQSYSSFVAGFAETLDVRVEDLEVLNEDGSRATVRVEISSVELDGSTRRFGGSWITVREGGEWQLDGAYMTPL